MRKRPRVLVVGQAMKHTGYARVLTSILERLHDEFEFLHFGINHRGDAVDGRFRVEPNRLPGDPLGKEQLPALLAAFEPVVVLLCHDPCFWRVHRDALLRAPRAPKTIFYCPIEWPFVRPRDADFASLDRLVLYTEYGRAVVGDAFAALDREPGASRPTPPIEVIPHGVDTSLFRPLDGASARDRRCRARRALFPERSDLDDCFIVLNANRNCPRKRVDLTLRAFAAFARDKRDARLCLHMGMRDAGVDILAHARRLGIEDRLLLTTRSHEKPAVSDEHLNVIYNACEVGVNTATGEGWGLVAFEHAATFAAQVMPDHSACRELWHEAGLLATLDADSSTPGVVSTDAVALELERLYRDRALLERKSRQAQEYARLSRFRWDDIAAHWRRLMTELASDGRFGQRGR